MQPIRRRVVLDCLLFGRPSCLSPPVIGRTSRRPVPPCHDMFYDGIDIAFR